MALSPAQILETVERSPQFVAAQDKAGWLALFSSEGSVEDPVGSAINRRGANAHPRTHEDDLGRFWETFIAGNEIRFEVKADRLGGSELARNVIIHTRLSTGLAIQVPAYLIYEIVEENGEPRIKQLRACWDLRQRSVSALAAGLSGLWTLTVMSTHMMRVQPFSWVLRYSRALTSGIFARGRKVAGSLEEAMNKRDRAALESLFDAQGIIELPVGQPRGPGELIGALAEGESLRFLEPISAGWLTGFAYERTRPGSKSESGIGFLEFSPESKRIVRARFFAG